MLNEGPPIMSLFCSGCKDEMENAGVAISDTRMASTTQQFCKILEGVADCLPCHGDGTLVSFIPRLMLLRFGDIDYFLLNSYETYRF